MRLDGQPRMLYRSGHLARAALTAAGLVLFGIMLILGRDWLRVIGPPRLLMQSALAALLVMILAGYLLIVSAAACGLVILGGSIGWFRLRRALERGSRLAETAARWLLLCGSVVTGSVLAEGAAAAWLAWIHRIPTLPSGFTEPDVPSNDIGIVVIGGSSAMGVPYEGWLSLGQIIGHELQRESRRAGFMSRSWPRRGQPWRPCIGSSPA